MTGPPLPRARGPLSRAVLSALAGEPPAGPAVLPWDRAASADPFGEDLQLALCVCYELHYQGFDGVADGWEWEPGLLRLRRALEERFLAAVRARVPDGGEGLEQELDDLARDSAVRGGVDARLLRDRSWPRMREYFVHRSVYQLKEADPQAWAIPRLRGQAKASFVAVEFDEFGGGHGPRVHAQLFADLMSAAGLDAGYLHLLDRVPACTLAPVNLMTLLGLHRALRGALVGHFALTEITTPPLAGRMARALERLGAPEPCVRFYTEHIEADAVHEQVLRRDVVGDLVRREPDQAPQVLFGVRATRLLDDRLARHMLACWDREESSLRSPPS
jgi:hypothetical protein